jgi:phosphoribosylglycinamide formyltransferase-1
MNIAIFASGGGSNALKIIEYFKGAANRNIVLVVSNKQEAGVLDIARAHQIPTLLTNRHLFYDTPQIQEACAAGSVDLIVLAGFLWLIPPGLVQAYPGRIINIHPALLPAFGGKGMFGMHVHEAVKSAGVAETGMTIHFVNAQYDEGDTIFQARCAVDPTDTPADIARKVLVLEHRHYPEVIEHICRQLEKRPA